MQGGPICILCLRGCDSSGCLSSCSHFFCARCIPRLPPANPPSSPPQCPICKRPYRLISINSTAVQPLLQDPNNLLKTLCQQQGHQQQVIQRMREALRVLKEEVKTKERKYREKSAMLDRIIHQQHQQHQQQQQQMQMQQQQQQMQQMPYPHAPLTHPGARASQAPPLLAHPLPHPSPSRVQPSTPRDLSHPSPFSFGRGGGGGLAAPSTPRHPSEAVYGPGVGHPAGAPHRPPSTPAPLPLPAMSHEEGRAGPPPLPMPSAPLGWSATSGILLPTPRSGEGSVSSGAAGRLGSAGGGRRPAAATATGVSLSEALKQSSGRSSFRLSTPLDRSTATPDLLWPR